MFNVVISTLRFGSASSIAACILILGSGCGAPPPPVADLPPPEVTVTVPVSKELTNFMEFTGRTEAIENVEVRARVTGYLVAVNFEEGEEVSAGDVLFEIDPRPYEAAHQAAVAAVSSAEAELKKAEADATRDRKAFEKGAVSEAQRDTSAALEGIASAAIDAAKADLKSAELDLEFTKVKAPVSGRVGRALITKGNLISSNQVDSILTTVVSVSPVDVYFDIDERALLRLQRKMREQDPNLRPESVREANVQVDIQLADEDDFSHHGVLDFANNQIDPETGTIRVRARFANEDEFLHAGMFVRVHLPYGDSGKKLLIPERAIGTDQGQRYVLIVKDDNSTERRDVTLGVRHGGGLRIIESGLKGDERVIVEGIQRVRPPAPVAPTEIAVQEAPSEPNNSPEQDDPADSETVSSS